MIDWELYENYRKTAGRRDEERLALITERWMSRVCGSNRDTHFFAGNLAKRQHQFLLLGAFWPPKQTVKSKPVSLELALF